MPAHQVHTAIYTRPDGERIVRTTTSSIGHDGRVTQRVEERSLGYAGGRAAGASSQQQPGQQQPPPPPSLLRNALRALAAPYIAAAAATAVRVLSRALVAAAATFVRALVRRILGGR